MTRTARIAVSLVPCAILIFLLIVTVRLFTADVLSRSTSLYGRQTAVRLFPGDVTYILSLVDLRRQNELEVRDQLRLATLADPLEAHLFIDLGLETERAGDFDTARRYLLEAARLSNEFLPPWTLANYYFRRDNMPECVKWLRRAIEIGTADMRPAFRLLSLAGVSSSEMANTLPRTRHVFIPLLDWAVSDGRMDLVHEVGPVVVRQWPHAQPHSLLRYCALLAVSSASDRLQAADVWNTLVADGVLAQTSIFPATAPRVVDSGFTDTSGSLAFGWRLNTVEGIIPVNYSKGLRLEFEGTEPDRWPVLMQVLSLRPGASYVVRCSYQSSGLPASSGLFWRVEDPDTYADLTQTTGFLNDAQHSVDTKFTATGRFARLVLTYVRPPGTVKIAGSVLLLQMDLNP